MQQLHFLGFALFDDKGNLRSRSKILFWFVAALIALAFVCLFEPPRRRDLMYAASIPFAITLGAAFLAVPIEHLIFARLMPKYKHFGQQIATAIVLILIFLLMNWNKISTNTYDSFARVIIRLLTRPETIAFFLVPTFIYICINGLVSKYAAPATKQPRTDILDDL